MTIALAPEVEARLRAVAAAHGSDPYEYAANLLSEVVLQESEEDLTAEETARLHAGIERGLAQEREGRVHPAHEVFARLEAKYGLPPRSGTPTSQLRSNEPVPKGPGFNEKRNNQQRPMS